MSITCIFHILVTAVLTTGYRFKFMRKNVIPYSERTFSFPSISRIITQPVPTTVEKSTGMLSYLNIFIYTHKYIYIFINMHIHMCVKIANSSLKITK
jgi:hypothetical protein